MVFRGAERSTEGEQKTRSKTRIYFLYLLTNCHHQDADLMTFSELVIILGLRVDGDGERS